MKIYLSKIENDREAYALLARAYRENYGTEMPEIKKTSDGKPYFVDADIRFSISHSGGFAACVLSGQPVGIDVQITRNTTEHLRKRILSPRETEDFFIYWCLKESFIKLIGTLDREYAEMEFIRDGEFFTGPDGVFGKVLFKDDTMTLAVCSCDKKELQNAEFFKYY